MKLSAKDFRTLQQAADVADAQREFTRLYREGFRQTWHAEAGLLAMLAMIVFGLGAIIATDQDSSDPGLSSERIVATYPLEERNNTAATSQSNISRGI